MCGYFTMNLSKLRRKPHATVMMTAIREDKRVQFHAIPLYHTLR